MDINAELAVSQQAFRKLVEMRQPAQVPTWKPDDAQKAEYIRLAETVADTMDKLGALEARQLLSEGKVQYYIPEGLLAFIHLTIPRPGRCPGAQRADHPDPW